MVEIRVTDSGRPTALIDGRYLHSRHDPEKEASRTVASIVRREPPCVVILGFGLGYVAEALLEGTVVTHLIVFEPDQLLTEELRRGRDVAHITDSHRVSWCTDIAQMGDALVQHAAAGFEVVSLHARRLAGPREYEMADEALASFRSRIDINSNTLNRFGKLWVRNLCSNIDPISRGLPVTRLRGLFDGMPGVLLAAGPGLDQVLPQLAELSERAIVVAVDTAVSAAVRHGVEPDVAVVVDPQYWNARHLDGVRPSRTVLVAESSTHPSVFSHFRSPPVFCSSLFPLGRAIESALGPLGSLGTGGSVSTTAWDLLRYAGCATIYAAGLDLGFPNGRTHFRGSFFETLAVALANRLAPAEATIDRYVRSADPVLVEATDGTQVITDRRMEVYRIWFARQVSAAPVPRSYTLSTGGVRIPGIEVASPDVMLSLPTIRSEIERRMQNMSAEPGEHGQQQRARILESLQKLAADLGELEKLGAMALSVVDGIERDLSAGSSFSFSELTAIDTAIGQSSGQGVASFLMHRAISSITSGYGSADLNEQVRASRDLYGALVESARFHRRELLRALDSSGGKKPSS